RQRLLQRVARAELRLLAHPLQALVPKRAANRVAAMPDDNAQSPWRERASRFDHVRKERATGERMQHLGKTRMHALALARGEHDDLQSVRGHANKKGRGWPLPGCVAPLIKEFRDPLNYARILPYQRRWRSLRIAAIWAAASASSA